MKKVLAFLLMCTTLSFSQTITFTGVVADTLGAPLESANLIAKPMQQGAQLKFAIADSKGRYRLQLAPDVTYEITASYIGFQDQVFTLVPDAAISGYDFVLKAEGSEMKEITITYDYKPVIVKKDTLIYDVGSFASGNERKMKEILEKLPGVEVAKDGTVTVQGKRVTQMLVEGDSFFGGGSRLAIENIPADALDKIEVIDHFNEVGFMKEVSGSEELAMNVKLREDKKRFVFGDIEAAAGNDRYHLVHAAMFYYSPKTNVSVIGDVNNIGQRTFTFDDMMRFTGGMSAYLSGRKPMADLFSFTNDNTDFVENRSQFAAVNFSNKFSDKLKVSGFGLFSKIIAGSRTETELQYLQNESPVFENRKYAGNSHLVMALGNLKFDFDRVKNEKWLYNAQYQFSNNDFSSTLRSMISEGASTFNTLRNADNSNIKQYFEWHKSYNSNHVATIVASQGYDKTTPQSTWISDRAFLPGLLEPEAEGIYRVNQVKDITNNNADVLLRHYWILNSANHIYTVLGNNYGSTRLKTEDGQLMADGSLNSFDGDGFGNKVDYRLNDTYAGMEYKFRIGKLTNRPGLYYHMYNLSVAQEGSRNKVSRGLLQPQWNTDYEFSKFRTLKFSYKLANEFPEARLYAQRSTLLTYNTIFRGNGLLQNERYHSALLYYTSINMYRGLMMNSSLSFNRKTRTLRNKVVLEEVSNGGAVLINQYTTPVLTHNPETNWNVSGTLQKKIYRFRLNLDARAGWFTYIQSLNGVTTKNERQSQDLGISLQTAEKTWPFLSVGYTKQFGRFTGLTNSTNQTDVIDTKVEYEVFPGWLINADYEFFTTTASYQERNSYSVGNASLTYQKKNSPWAFEGRVKNFLDNRQKQINSFSDYTVSAETTYILPRIVLLTIRYKL